MARPCGHTTHAPGCPACRWCLDDSADGRAYRELWGEPEPDGRARASRLPCVHLGGPTGRTIFCPFCPNDLTNGSHVPVLGCAVHGTTTGRRQARDPERGGEYHRSCWNCPDFRPGHEEEQRGDAPESLPYGERPIVRHLLFHVWPRRDNGAFWRWHVGQLKQRMGLFNGRRIVAVATDDDTDSLADVQRAFGDDVTEYVTCKNEPKLREVATAPTMLSMLESTAPNEVIFYAQGKGVRFPHQYAIRRWIDVMYSACLDYWPLVERLLVRYGTAGAFKHIGTAWDGCPWHYSGSYYWLRSSRLFSRDWRGGMPWAWYGIEAYPGVMFAASEAACLFDERPLRPEMAWNYLDEHVRDWVEPAWGRWQEEHESDRQEWEAKA